ncbi:hypothetical protein QOT17_007452 [Balamuthia mandrillaris]
MKISVLTNLYCIKLPRWTASMHFLNRKAFMIALVFTTFYFSSLVGSSSAAAPASSAAAGGGRRGLAAAAGITAGNFTQPVDHFDLQNGASFHQRFWLQKSWWKDQSNGIVLLYINSFIWQPDGDLTTSAVAEWAKELGAMLIEIEPRYSGQSYPVRDVTSTNIRFSTIEQNIADYSDFIANMTKTLQLNDPRWIIVADLFNGAYATWLRAKNPQLVFGSVATSPYMLATLEDIGYDSAYQAWLGEACSSVVHDAVYNLSRAWSSINTTDFQHQMGCKQLLPNEEEFFYVLNSIFTSYYSSAKDLICANLTAKVNANTSDKLANFAKLLKELRGDSSLDCIDFDIALDTNTTIPSIFSGYRPTYYLKCAQLGQFQTPKGNTSLIPPQLTLTWYLQTCKKLFSDVHIPDQPQIDVVNALYGGENPEGCNMIFVTSKNDLAQQLVPDAKFVRDKSDTNRFLEISCENPTITYSWLDTSVHENCLKDVRNQILSTLKSWKSQNSDCTKTIHKGGDSNKSVLVGFLTGTFGIIFGVLLGGAIVLFITYHFYGKWKRSGWEKLG